MGEFLLSLGIIWTCRWWEICGYEKFENVFQELIFQVALVFGMIVIHLLSTVPNKNGNLCMIWTS